MRRLGALLLVLVLAGCASPAPEARDATPASAAAALIVDVQGEAALKRQGWRDYAPAVFGATLRRGDLVRTSASGKAVVACSDLALAELSGGVKGYPCATQGAAPIVFEGALVNATRGDPAADYPIVLSPRKTKLLGARPLLRWEAYAGATTYKVSLQGAGWQAEVMGATEMRYPADAPPLEAGRSYRLIVEANGRSSAEEPGAGLGFALLPAASAAAVRAEEARARALGLGDEATRLLIANLYAGHGLYSEALELLELERASRQPALARLAGDLALAVGLLRTAETAYVDALARSTQAGDAEGQALASRGLGTVYTALGNADEAKRYFAAARRAFEDLGDRQSVEEIDAALK